MTEVPTVAPAPVEEIPVEEAPVSPYRVRRIEAGAPLRWLSNGLADFAKLPLPSLLYGLLFVLAGYGLLWLTRNDPQLILVSVSGFFILAPFLAVGLYAVSQKIHEQQAIRWWTALSAWCCNPLQIALFAVFLCVVFLAWIRVVALLVALFAVASQSNIQMFLQDIYASEYRFGFFALFVGSGALLAFVVYLFSVITFPFLVAEKGDLFTGVRLSIQSVFNNFWPMLFWAFLIVVLVGISIALAYVPLLLFFPVIGYASAHAYRDLVEKTENP